MERHRLQRFACVLLAAVAFGVLVAVLKGQDAGARDTLGNLSAPWVLVPFFAGARFTRVRSGALAGGAATLAALLGFYVAEAAILDLGPHPWYVDLRLTAGSLNVYEKCGLVSGALYGALGALWASRALPWAALAVGLAFVAEPLIVLLLSRAGIWGGGELLHYPAIWITEVLAGVSAIALVASPLQPQIALAARRHSGPCGVSSINPGFTQGGLDCATAPASHLDLTLRRKGRRHDNQSAPGSPVSHQGPAMTDVAAAHGGATLSGDRGAGRRRARWAVGRIAVGFAVCVTVVAAVTAGTGWLYILRHDHALALGPRFHGALPLQQLAGGDAQRLGRIAAAWVPAGLVLGLALAVLTRLPRYGRAAIAALGGIVILLPASAFSDALAQNDPVSAHIPSGFTRPGVWLSIALFVVGVLAAPPWKFRHEEES